MMKAKSISFRANGNDVLRTVDLTIHAAACILLTGDNGSGKSTLLRILAGLLRPSQGEIELDGTILPFSRARSKLLKSAVYLHQKPYMFDQSVRDNIAYGLERLGVGTASLEQRVEGALEWAGLGDLAHRNARRLSGGEQQRLAIARAQVLNPRLLLLDEPTAGLDRDGRERTLRLIEQLKTKRTSIVLATHDPAQTLTGIDTHLHLGHGTLRVIDR